MMAESKHKISASLQHWYQANKRELPWRKTNDPYKIWVSEVVLQQTRVAQGTDYYLRFVAAFPDVQSLANASEEKVLKMWQGLGYYSRARNMHAAAGQVLKLNNGVFPNKNADLLLLMGIGPYTAAAISSITSGEAVATVDGNVERVLSRLFLVENPVNESQGKKEISALAASILDTKNAGDHNQAMMEMGALVCTPKNPNCAECVLQIYCMAYEKGKQAVLPVKTKKIKQRKRYFNYYFIQDGEFTFMAKRKSGDVWEGLHELFLIESDSVLEPDNALKNLEEKVGLSSNDYVIQTEVRYKHILSHQIIHATFFSIQVISGRKLHIAGYEKVSFKDVLKLPVSRLTDRFLKENNL